MLTTQETQTSDSVTPPTSTPNTTTRSSNKRVCYEDYLRQERMPALWCSGCGDGIVMKAMIKGMDALGLDKDQTSVVSGIGCSGRVSSYLDMNTLHTPHGRTLPFATGIKLSQPKATVMVVAGDGDALAIGGNHFLHACRRNIDLTLIIINNFIYGLTGGQFSPTSPTNSIAQTTPQGSLEMPFDTVKLAIASGATYVARSTVSNPRHISQMIEGGLRHSGFSVIEVISNCHINYGRNNVSGKPEEFMEWIATNTLSKSIAQHLSSEETDDKMIIGVLHHTEEQPEYVSTYFQKNDEIRRSL